MNIENNKDIARLEEIKLNEPKDIKIDDFAYLTNISSLEEEIKKEILDKSKVKLEKEYIEPIKIVEPFKIIPRKKTIRILWLYQYMEDVNYDHWLIWLL